MTPLDCSIADATGATVKTYTYGSDLIASHTTRSSLLTTRYYSYDGGGTVRELTDATGAITDSYDYDAYGILIFSAGTTANAYLYRGEQFDEDVGLYYLRARFMNPGSGRFWNMDTYEGRGRDPMSLHKHLYANANPVTGSDPSGNFTDVASLPSLSTATAIVGILAVVAVPQVFEQGIRAASIAIEAGLYGAGQAAENIEGRLYSFTLTLKIEQAKADSKASSSNRKRRGKAVIGETMTRVGAAGRKWGAETFRPIEFGGVDLPGFPLQTQLEFNRWMWANRAWIRSVMVRRFWVYDIGRDGTKVVAGEPRGQFYSMELEETAAYPLKSRRPWPASIPRK